MTEEVREELRQCLVPVLLDHGIRAHELAEQLWKQLEVTPILCGERKNAWDVLHPCCSFYRLLCRSDERLTAEQLRDLAEKYADCLLWLIPVTEQDACLVQAYAEVLEPYFICLSPWEAAARGLGGLTVPRPRRDGALWRKAKS